MWLNFVLHLNFCTSTFFPARVSLMMISPSPLSIISAKFSRFFCFHPKTILTNKGKHSINLLLFYCCQKIQFKVKGLEWCSKFLLKFDMLCLLWQSICCGQKYFVHRLPNILWPIFRLSISMSINHIRVHFIYYSSPSSRFKPSFDYLVLEEDVPAL